MTAANAERFGYDSLVVKGLIGVGAINSYSCNLFLGSYATAMFFARSMNDRWGIENTRYARHRTSLEEIIVSSVQHCGY